MQNRWQKTPGGILRKCATGALRLALTGTLFLPAWYVKLASEAAKPGPLPFNEKPKNIEFVKLFTIVKSQRPEASDAEAWRLADVILEESAKHKLDPMLVSALIEVESGFRKEAVSPLGARGIMQILPETARALFRDIGAENFASLPFSAEFLDDPVLNIKLGVYYLQNLKKTFRDLTLTLAAYNLGPTEIRNRLENNAHVSEEYAAAVLTVYQKHKQAETPAF